MSTPTVKPPTLASQVSRAVVWNTLFVPLRLVAEVVATLLKLTVLAPASYGMLSIIKATNDGLGTWIDLGTGRALPKYIPETVRNGGPRAMYRLLAIVLGAQFALLALVGLGFALFYEQYLGDLERRIAADTAPEVQATLLGFVGEFGWLIIGSVLLLLVMGVLYDVLMAYLSSFFKQRAWNSIALAAGLLPPLLTVIVILAGYDVAGVLVAGVLAPTIAVALVIWQVLRHQREIAALPQPEHDDGRWLPEGFVRYSGVSLLMTATDFLASAGFVVFFVQSLVEVALLTAGVSIVRMVLGYLYTPLVGVQVPLFTRVRQGEGGTILGAYQSITRLQALLIIPGGVGLMLLAEPIFALLIPQYIAAAPLVWVLVPMLFLECLLTTAHNVLIVYEKLRIIIISRLLTLVSVPLVLILTPVLGIVGAALAFGIARVVAGLWVTASGYKLLDLRWPWTFTWRVTLASAAMAVLVALCGIWFGGPDPDATRIERLLSLPLLFAIAAIGGTGFLLVLRLLGGLDPADRSQIERMKLPLKRWILKLL
jgi:O-antigen/teichoic acid export membrane protein